MGATFVARTGQTTNSIQWVCHNDREEDQSGSPRESRVTVAPGFEAVNTTG
jgi:hypothetical protein